MTITIRFAIVSSDLLEQVRAEVDVLQIAVNAGNMDRVDSATGRLLAMTVDCRSIDMPENEWRTFLNDTRSKNPEFKSDYLLPGDTCAHLLPTIAAGDYVLELPIDTDMVEESIDV